MNTNIASEYAALFAEKRELEKQLEVVKGQIAQREPEILRAFEDSGIVDIRTVNGLVFLHSQLWAGIADGCSKEQACAGLRDAGLGDFVAPGFNTNTLSAHFRSIAEAEDLLDPTDQPTPAGLKLTQKFAARVRQS